MNDHHNEHFRFGSARFATHAELRRGGFLRRSDGAVMVGFHRGFPIWYDDPGGMSVVAGARGGKLRDFLGYNICSGILKDTLLILDVKGELSAIAQDQTADGKFCYYWNPANLHGLPQDRINPVDYLKIDSPTLVSDTKLLCENLVPASGSAQAVYFERRAQEFLEGLVLTLVRLNSSLTLPALYDAVNLIPGGGEAWLDLAFEMSESGFPVSVRIEEEIAASREDSGGGFQGILGEIFKALAPLSDPLLRASVSPPFTARMEDLCDSDQRCHLSLMPPAEFLAAWAPVLKSFFVAGMVYKSRLPHAPRQTWILDECAQLGTFPLITKLYSYGAGIGIRPVTIWQSQPQMKSVGPDAESIIPSSSACQLYFAIRDLPSAQGLSKRLGIQTLEYDDPLLQERAERARQKALQAMIDGHDPINAALDYDHHRKMATHRTKQQRWLRTPDEVLGTKDNRAYLFVDGLAHPAFVQRKPYWEQRFMAYRFHPNPYHPPADSVRIKTRFRHAKRRVITEPVPARYAHYPQYRDGLWSRIGR